MIRIQNTKQNNSGLTRYLSPLPVWALAFGCAVGWGAFVMPGTTFLPIAGPWGAVIGLLIGAVIMLIIGLSYHVLTKRYPNAGGSYTFAAKILGSDHGFLCAWMLLLTYAAIIWANSTALSLIVRFLFGNFFCFGFSYQIAGYTVYMGEVLLSVAIITVACLICVISKRLAAWVQTVCALLLFLGITVCFLTIVIRRGGLSGITPAFSSQGKPFDQIMTIVILAPWAFIGFESISHSAEEFKFKPNKTLPILIGALAAGALAYTMLTLCASVAIPDGFNSWTDYITALPDVSGIRGLPTFHAAQKTMGTAGTVIMGVASFCGIFTGLIGNMIALSRLIYRMSADNMLPKRIGALNKKGIPTKALWTVALISMIIPFFGRTAIGWIVDVTTIGATIVYIYVSVCAAVISKREKKMIPMVIGIIGALISVTFAIFYLLPHIRSQSELAAESYMILIIWSLLGMIVFRVLMQRDKSRLIGKSTVVWIILFCLILLVSVSWVNRTTVDHAKQTTVQMQTTHTKLAGQAGLEPDNDSVRETNELLEKRFTALAETVRRNVLILGSLLLGSLLLIFSIFSIIRKREQLIEAERLVAEESSRAKSAFLSNMSHDIRTPMNAITGYTALALKEEGIPDSTRTYLEKIDTSSKRLLSLINDILDMSRIESGKMELDLAPADLIEIFDETCHIFDLQMQAKPLTYTIDHSRVDHRYVKCDKNRVNRILLNLISNAYKYTPAGGSVTAQLSEIEIAGSERVYEISVKDTGIGMSPEFAEHIFDSFERERSRTVDAIQGTGLGMAITKNLVDIMGGSILVQTEQDKGTTFTIRLSFPIVKKEDVHPPTETAEEEKAALTGAHILLAEDNPINSEIATMILTQEGFTVDHAENGQIAVEMMEQADDSRYQAILMDIQMPVMNGYDATRKIRAMSGEKANIPIIAVTANTFVTDRQEAFDAGINAHIAKPFNPDELVQTLVEQINNDKT